MNKDVKIRWTRGRGSGGQNKNKTENCCNLTHLPTGIEVRVDARDRKQSLREALRRMQKLLDRHKRDQEQQKKSKRRAEVIQPGAVGRVRTYDYSRDIVTDHRTGKTASVKDIIGKGRLDKLR